MISRSGRALSVALLTGLTATTASAQVGAPALAPQHSLPLDLPGPADEIDRRRGATLAPVSPGSPTKTVLSLSAYYAEGSPPVESGIHWRIFSDQPDLNGNHALVHESTDAKPFVTLDPGGYIVHIAYGLVSETRHVIIGTESVGEEIVLNAGALRFSGAIGDTPISSDELTFEVHRAESEESDLVAEVKANQILRLKAGSYQVTSTYGQANAKVISEISVEPGKLTDAAVLHKAGHVDLRLTNPAGGEISDATWSILTPGGDVVVETLSALHNVVLAEGEYVAVARHEGQIFQRPFDVESGSAVRVDLAAN